MSGVISSKRQWASTRVRALAAVLLALAMLIPVIGNASAQSAQPTPYAADNKLCITGTVINFDETLLEAGWQITATPVDPTGAVLQTTTNDDGYFEFLGLTPGKWNVALTIQQYWEPVLPYSTNFDVTLGYGASKCTEVRFKIKRPVTVNVYKIDDNHNRLSGWTIRAEPARGNYFASPVEVTTDGDGLASFRLTEGKWIFTEKPPKGQAYTPVIPESGKQEVDIIWGEGDTAGQVIMLRFKNRLAFNGCIDVTKLDVPPSTDTLGAYGLPGWKITVKRPNGTIAASGLTDALGKIKFANLPYGPYIVTEESRIGWDAVGTSSFQVNVTQPGTGDNAVCEEITFFNKQNPAGYCIEGYKIDHNGNIGIPGWKITATPIYKGSYPNKDIDGSDKLEALTDGTGKYTFTFPNNDYRIPGAAYKVCEETRDGWLPHTATCQTVYLPHKPSACVKAWSFVNQQVGHWESLIYGKHTSSSSSCSYSHTVVAGESLYGIGNAYGVSASAMLSANPWIYNRSHHYVYVGDSVCIP